MNKGKTLLGAMLPRAKAATTTKELKRIANVIVFILRLRKNTPGIQKREKTFCADYGSLLFRMCKDETKAIYIKEAVVTCLTHAEMINM